MNRDGSCLWSCLVLIVAPGPPTVQRLDDFTGSELGSFQDQFPLPGDALYLKLRPWGVSARNLLFGASYFL